MQPEKWNSTSCILSEILASTFAGGLRLSCYGLGIICEVGVR